MKHLHIEELFNKYADMVYRICKRYAKSREDAEDMVQNVFLKVHKNLNNFHNNSSIMTWIYRIAVNTCIDELRSQKSRDLEVIENIDSLVVNNIACESDTSLTKITLDKILDEVNADTKEMLFLVYAEGLSQNETSKLLGVNRTTVTRRLSRFREQVKRKESVVSELFPKKA